MNLYEKLLNEAKESCDKEVELSIILTFKPDASYTISRLDPSDVSKDEWLVNKGIYDDLSLDFSGKIEYPDNLKGISCSINITSPIHWGEIKYKDESALGWGFDNGENGLHCNIRLNSNIQKNIVEKIYWIDKLLKDKKVEKFLEAINFMSTNNEIGDVLSKKEITVEETSKKIHELLNEYEDEENKQDLSFKIVIKNFKKQERKSALGSSFSFHVERMYF